jgi:anaerobic magnesium-protoporphyrin IX monomethyl ester cyclase
MSINQFSPYPGSELFDDLVKEGRVDLDEEYFEALSYYSSMTNARSYSERLSSRDILIFKFVGTSLFYALNFLYHPGKLVRTWINVRRRTDTTRLEKTLISYLGRGATAAP